MPQLKVKVVKLGGSLFDLPDLKSRVGQGLRQIEGETGDVCHLILAGGGVFADRVRREQQIAGWSDAESHRRALLAMQQSSIQMAETLQINRLTLDGKGRLVDGEQPWSMRPGFWIVDLAAAAIQASEIPPSWDCTSDSLSAWLAARLSADALVLLKSRSPLAAWTPISPVSDGWVDPLFHTYGADLPLIQWIHLRDDRRPFASGQWPHRA